MTRHDLIWLIGTLLGAAAIMAAFTVGLRDGGAGFLGFAFVSIVVLGLRDLLNAWHVRSVRHGAMRQAADRLGFSFRTTAPANVLGWPHSLRLTREAMKLEQAPEQSPLGSASSRLLCASRNVMERTMDEAKVAIFDYECESSSSDATICQTVFAVRSTLLPATQFTLLAASSWDRLVDRFRDESAIQDQHRLISDGEVQLGDLDERLFQWLDRHMTLEAAGGCMLLYKRGQLVAPHEIDDFLATGMQIYSLLSRIQLANHHSA
jgi:hypothetical protein